MNDPNNPQTPQNDRFRTQSIITDNPDIRRRIALDFRPITPSPPSPPTDTEQRGGQTSTLSHSDPLQDPGSSTHISSWITHLRNMSELGRRAERSFHDTATFTNISRINDAKSELEHIKRKCENTEMRNAALVTTVQHMQHRLSLIEHTSYDGHMHWRLPHLHYHVEQARNGNAPILNGPPCYTHIRGYQFSVHLYLDGYGSADRGHVSLFFILSKSSNDQELSWPFSGKIVLRIKQGNNTLERHFSSDDKSTPFERPRELTNPGYGYHQLMPTAQLMTPAGGDEITIECITTISAPKTTKKKTTTRSHPKKKHKTTKKKRQNNKHTSKNRSKTTETTQNKVSSHSQEDWKILGDRRDGGPNSRVYLCHKTSELKSDAKWRSIHKIGNSDAILRYLEGKPENEPPPPPPPPPQRRSAFTPPKRWFPPISFLLFFLLFAVVENEAARCPYLGKIWDCDKSTFHGIYSIPPTISCPVAKNTTIITSFSAPVQQYEPETTTVILYHCVHLIHNMYCKEQFFGSDNKQERGWIAGRVSAEDCRIAASKRVSRFGKLDLVSEGKYATKYEDHYTCHYLRGETEHYDHFYMNMYSATVIGTDPNIHQTLTMTPCKHDELNCRPKEAPDSIVVWDKPKHEGRVFKELGTMEIQLIDDQFLLVPALGIGGTIVEQSQGTYLTDTGYLIGQNLSTISSHLHDTTVEFTKHNIFSAKNDIERAETIARLAQQSTQLLYLAKSMCAINQKIRNMERWILHSQVDSAQSLMYDGFDKYLSFAGDAIRTYRCSPVTQYKVHWDRTLNGKCYALFPISIGKGNDTIHRFLDITDRKVHQTSLKIKCIDRMETTYVMDNDQQLWSLNQEGFCFKAHPMKHSSQVYHHQLTRLTHDAKTLTRNPRAPQHRLSLLQILGSSKAHLSELQDKADEGGGNLFTGITMAVASTISAAAEGGSQLLGAIAHGITEVVTGSGNSTKTVLTGLSDATTHVIAESTSGIATIFKSLTSSLLLWILVGGLYLLHFRPLYQKWGQKRELANKIMTIQEKPETAHTLDEHEHIKVFVRNGQQIPPNIPHNTHQISSLDQFIRTPRPQIPWRHRIANWWAKRAAELIRWASLHDPQPLQHKEPQIILRNRPSPSYCQEDILTIEQETTPKPRLRTRHNQTAHANLSFTQDDPEDLDFSTFRDLTPHKPNMIKKAINNLCFFTRPKLPTYDDFPIPRGNQETIPTHQHYEIDPFPIDLRQHMHFLQCVRYDGKLEWIIHNITQHLSDAEYDRTKRLHSPYSFQGPNGIKFRLTVFPFGTNEGFAKYLSVYFCIMRSSNDEKIDWPFAGIVTVSLIRGHLIHTERFLTNPTLKPFQKPTTPLNEPHGFPKFLRLIRLKEYIKNDYIRLECAVENIMESPFKNMLNPELPAPTIDQSTEWIITDHRPHLLNEDELEYLSRRANEKIHQCEWRTALQINNDKATINYLAMSQIAQFDEVMATAHRTPRPHRRSRARTHYLSTILTVTLALTAYAFPHAGAHHPEFSACKTFHTLRHNLTVMQACLNLSDTRTCVTSQVFAPPIDPIPLYRCTHTRTTISFLGITETRQVRVSRRKCKTAVINGTFEGYPLKTMPNSTTRQVITDHPYLIAKHYSTFTLYKNYALLIGPAHVLDQPFLGQHCNYYAFQCRARNAKDIWMWLRTKAPKGAYEFVGEKEAILVNNDTMIVPTLRLITKIVTPHLPDLTGTNGYYFSHVQVINCTSPQN